MRTMKRSGSLKYLFRAGPLRCLPMILVALIALLIVTPFITVIIDGQAWAQGADRAADSGTVNDGNGSVAPLNPAFVDYMQSTSCPMVYAAIQASATDNYGNGYIPTSVDLSHMKGKKVDLPIKSDKLPSSYVSVGNAAEAAYATRVVRDAVGHSRPMLRWNRPFYPANAGISRRTTSRTRTAMMSGRTTAATS